MESLEADIHSPLPSTCGMGSPAALCSSGGGGCQLWQERGAWRNGGPHRGGGGDGWQGCGPSLCSGGGGRGDGTPSGAGSEGGDSAAFRASPASTQRQGPRADPAHAAQSTANPRGAAKWLWRHATRSLWCIRSALNYTPGFWFWPGGGPHSARGRLRRSQLWGGGADRGGCGNGPTQLRLSPHPPTPSAVGGGGGGPHHHQEVPWAVDGVHSQRFGTVK